MILVDAMMQVCRCAYSLSELQTRGGRRTGMELGFLKGLEALRREFKDEIILCWEGQNNFRYRIDPEYKANRSQKQKSYFEKSFISNERLSEFRRILKYIAHSAFRDGLEADDIIASLAQRFAETEPVLIYSGDKDLHQLLKNKPFPVVQVKSYQVRDNPWTVQRLAREFNGITPQQFPIYQAFIGDKIDNIPGVPRLRKTLLLDAMQAGYTPENMFEYPLFSTVETNRLEEHIKSGRFATNLALAQLCIDPDIIVEYQDKQLDTVGEWLEKLEIRSLKLCRECGIEVDIYDEDEF